MAGHTINVSVLADTRRFSSAMKRLGRDSGLSRLGEGFRRAGRRIVDFFKTGIKWATAFGAAIMGLAVKGGIERLLAIEDAEAKLAGLGHTTAEVERIMDSALQAVLGTAYGLDEAGTAAANAVASGVEPGQDLERQLRLIGDAATIAGTDFGEMGDIFSKITAANRVSMQEVNSLMSQGIPILQWLADEFDTTADAVRDMVSRGEIDAETFRDAVEENIGGAALEAGNTTRGAFANMRAALSRFGVALLEDIFPMFREAFVGITGWLDEMTEKVQPIGEAFGLWLRDTAVPAVQRLARWLRDDLMPALREVWDHIRTGFASAWERISEAMDDAGISAEGTGKAIGDFLVSALEDLGPLIEDVLERVGNFVAYLIENRDIILTMASAITGLLVAFKGVQTVEAATDGIKGFVGIIRNMGRGGWIGLAIVAVGALIGALTWFFTQTERGREVVETVWGAIRNAIEPVVTWFTDTAAPAIAGAWDTITTATAEFTAWWDEHVGPVIEAGGELIQEVWATLQEAGEELNQALTPLFEAIGEAWESMWSGIDEVWQEIGPPIIEAITLAWAELQNVTGLTWENIKTAIETALGFLESIIRGFTSLISGDWEGFMQHMGDAANTAWEGIKTVVRRAVDFVKDRLNIGMGDIGRDWSTGWSGVQRTVLTAWNNIRTGVSERVEALVRIVRAIPGLIRAVFSGVGTWLRRAGSSLIGGFIDGIRSRFNNVRSTLQELTSQLPDWKGPARRDRTILQAAGQDVIDGFITGLESRYGLVRDSLAGLTHDVASTPFQPLDASTAARQVRMRVGGTPDSPEAPQPQQVNVRVYLDGHDITGRIRIEAENVVDNALHRMNRSALAGAGRGR